MIASLQGQIIVVDEGHAVLEIGGVGFQVYVPAPLLDELRVGEEAFFHTELVVREDSLTLFGFATGDARMLFKLLMGVSGIGPRLALAILSTLTPDSIRRAVFHEQPEVFSRVPGVGRKTAQKIQFHLQDRLPDLPPVAHRSFAEDEGQRATMVFICTYAADEPYAEVIEAEALETSPLVGRPIRDLDLPDGIRIGAIVHKGEVLKPLGETQISPGDRFVIFAMADQVAKVEQMARVSLEFF